MHFIVMRKNKPKEMLRPFIKSMPKRIISIIVNSGGCTKYHFHDFK